MVQPSGAMRAHYVPADQRACRYDNLVIHDDGFLEHGLKLLTRYSRGARQRLLQTNRDRSSSGDDR